MTVLPPRPPDLAGDFRVELSDQHADVFIRNQVAVRVEQDLRPHARYGYWQPVARYLATDQFVLDGVIRCAYDALRPWTRPDEPWPVMTLFPRLARLERTWRRWRG